MHPIDYHPGRLLVAVEQANADVPLAFRDQVRKSHIQPLIIAPCSGAHAAAALLLAQDVDGILDRRNAGQVGAFDWIVGHLAGHAQIGAEAQDLARHGGVACVEQHRFHLLRAG